MHTIAATGEKPHKPRKDLFSVISFLLIIAVTALSYSNSFFSPFVFDDDAYIVKNPWIFDLSNFWRPNGTRYFSYLSFAINYHFGALNVFGYHLVNFMVHALNAVLVYLLISLTLETSRIKPLLENGSARFAALFPALIFAAHPVQTQAVTYITQRFTSLAVLFYLLSLVFFVRWRLSGGSGTPFRAFLYLTALIFAAISQMTKEISFTLPVIIVLYDLIFFEKEKISRKYYLIPFFLCFLIIPINLFLIENNIGIAEQVRKMQTEELEMLSSQTYLLTQFRVIVTYMRLLVLPVNQNLDYEYPLLHSITEPQALLSLIFILAIIGTAIYLLRRSYRTNNGYLTVAAFGIFWFFITLSIESSIIPIKDVIFEQRLYLPSIGLLASLCFLYFNFAETARKRFALKNRHIIAPLAVAVISLGIVTFLRNSVWESKLSLTTDIAKKSPNKARSHTNLGIAYAEGGQTGEAISEFKEALRLEPGQPLILINLAVLYHRQGNIAESIMEFKKTLNLDQDNKEAHNYLGKIYMQSGQIDEAIQEFKEVSRIDPGDPENHNNLGVAYHQKGLTDEAIKEYLEALRDQPEKAETYFNLGVAYMAKGLNGQAIANYQKFIEYGSSAFGPEVDEVRSLVEQLKKENLTPTRP